MTPTKEQRQAAKLSRISEEAFAALETEIAQREAAAAYAGAMGVRDAVVNANKQSKSISLIGVIEDITTAAKQAADKLNPKP